MTWENENPNNKFTPLNNNKYFKFLLFQLCWI